ncbi:glutamate receptor U1-like [Centruroides sculpturatus]|uniref:glutamate receptor U1-like n=1 Tax=Centruroides sculpturatus TaxID=218467 RepID=UPI000C6E6AC1|nr:glutamate receptor U1-like [Centruroides sculpturatus]
MRLKTVQPLESTFGTKLKNGSWNGLIGKVQRKEVDIGLPYTYIGYDRFQVIDYLVPVLSSNLLFVVSPSEKASKLTTVIKPFSVNVWISILSSILMIGIAIYIQENKRIWTIDRIFWILIQILTERGANITAFKKLSTKIIIAAWLSSVSVLSCAYAAVLFSFLTCPIYETIPRTFEELSIAVQKKEYTCGTLTNSAMEIFLLNTKKNSAEFQVLADYIKMHPENSYDTVEQGMKRVLSKKYAYISSFIMADYASKLIGEHNFIFSIDRKFPHYFGFPLRKGFIFKNEFNKIAITILFGKKHFPRHSLLNDALCCVDLAILATIQNCIIYKADFRELGFQYSP